uniref:Receptor-like protein kinase ANXUR2 n=2 Tax=Cajanus cajan TaxID=3821 RepID=A0A151R3W2_CAJCA|nr:Receptor-like protein kinase ANXUR2 [Cajanus cajan]
MPNGSLHGHLQGGKLSWKKRLEICIGAARGLHYLHAGAKRTIIHRHIKPSYILLDHNMNPKLVGFGLSIQGARFMSKPKPIKINTPGYIRGNWEYLAKELLMDRTASDRCDVYSFGMILLEVVWAKTILDMESRGNFLKKPVEEYIDPNIEGKIAPECWQVFVDIIAGCLKNEPDERPAMGEVQMQLEHALSLQKQADITNTNAHYILLSKTIINRERQDITETTNSCGSLEDIESEDMFRT